MRRAAIGVLVVGLAACDDPLPSPRVDFQIDAPLCSSIIPTTLWVDGLQVGVDTFRVNYGPEHERTQPFETAAGNHKLAVRHPNGALIQEDSTVALRAGDQYTFTFGFYCS
jgi:hypothetical protein